MQENSGFEKQLDIAVKTQGLAIPRQDLALEIFTRIQSMEKANARKRLAIFSLGLCAAFALTVSAIIMARTELSRSGTLQILSLLFSDFSVVVGDWREFLLSVLESLPITSVVSVLACASFLLLTFKSFLQTLNKATLLTKTVYGKN